MLCANVGVCACVNVNVSECGCANVNVSECACVCECVCVVMGDAGGCEPPQSRVRIQHRQHGRSQDKPSETIIQYDKQMHRDHISACFAKNSEIESMVQVPW